MAINIPESQEKLYRLLDHARHRLEQAKKQGNRDMIDAYTGRVQDIREQILASVNKTPTQSEIRRKR